MDLIRDILDKQLIDCTNTKIGKVDGLVSPLPPDRAEPNLTLRFEGPVDNLLPGLPLLRLLLVRVLDRLESSVSGSGTIHQEYGGAPAPPAPPAPPAKVGKKT